MATPLTRGASADLENRTSPHGLASHRHINSPVKADDISVGAAIGHHFELACPPVCMKDDGDVRMAGTDALHNTVGIWEAKLHKLGRAEVVCPAVKQLHDLPRKYGRCGLKAMMAQGNRHAGEGLWAKGDSAED